MSSTDQPASQSSGGAGDAIMQSLFMPGLNTPMKRAMDASFFGLFLVLGALALITGGNVHVLALLGIAMGLFLSVNW